jgi:hypothetical protein
MDPSQGDVFLIVPPGTGYPDKTIMKLFKGLYGLKQSPRLWNLELVKALVKANYLQSELDKSIFYKLIDGKLIVIIIFVDDIFSLTEETHLVNDFKNKVLSKFDHKSIHPVKTFVGLQINFLKDGSIVLHQSEYVKKILTKYELQSLNPSVTPMETKNESTEHTDNVSQELKSLYQQYIGSLMYLSVSTRPDLAYAVSNCARAMSNPSNNDFLKVKRIFRYIIY